MSLSPGTRLGPYEIVALVGTGGMGQVYRALDTRLDRTVAIKVLSAHPAGHTQMRERFDREARAVSSLNHPHICTLHDIGRADGIDFFVMEYCQGETLAERLRGPESRRAIGIDEALKISIEIADALVTAHRAGIVHRDLKPGNIMLTKAGVKLLDFGIAKTAAVAQAGDHSVTAMPTTPSRMTVEGTILGTVQYMAPEQLEGKPLDARTDIFAFGALLHEMLTGRPAFNGASQASLIAAILGSTPPSPATVQPLTPPALDRFVMTCLAKQPDDRWQSTQDLLRELRWLGDRGSATATLAAPTGQYSRRGDSGG